MSAKNPTVDEIINAIDAGLESDNRHSESASNIWERMSPYIDPKKRKKAARALGEGMGIDVDHNLQYVTNDEENE
jgi:hypothetical protein